MKKYTQASLAIVLSLCMGSDAFSIGSGFISNEVPSARAAGQGYVGIAGQNNDPTAVYTNPAAMTALKGTQVTGGVTWENIHGSYVDTAGTETKERVTNVGVPNLSVTQSFMDGKLAAGFSVQSPFGLETYWDSNSPLRYEATDSRLDLVQLTPAIAFQVTPILSIGAGADYVDLFNAELNSQVPGATDGTSSLRGSGSGWGYHAGVVIQPNEKNAVGITYHSKVDIRIDGNLTLSDVSVPLSGVFGTHFQTNAYTDITLPSNVQFGYAFKPTEKWMLEADTAYYHWSEAKDINVRYPDIDGTTLAGATQLAVLNSSNPTPLTLRDVWSFATGVNYKASDKWQFRGGFWYEPWAMPESTFSPVYMDLSRYGLSTGAGFGITDNLTIDAAYTAVFMHNRSISNSNGVDGTYKDFANLVSLNFTYRFGVGK